MGWEVKNVMSSQSNVLEQGTFPRVYGLMVCSIKQSKFFSL